MLITDFTRQFKKDFKKYQYKQKVIDELNEVLEILVNEKEMPEKYQVQIQDKINLIEAIAKLFERFKIEKSFAK